MKKFMVGVGAFALLSSTGLLAACGNSTSTSSGGGSSQQSSQQSSSTGGASSNTNTAKSSSPILIDVFAPFSGSMAAYGKVANLPGVQAGAAEVNAAGGVLGHKIKVMTTDSIGDPADAIPIARQLVATHSNLAAVFGDPGDPAYSTTGIFNQAHIVDFSSSGLTSLNKVMRPYLYRLSPPDSAAAVAEAGYAISHHYTKAAFLFLTGADAQSTIKPLEAAYKKMGGTVVISQTLQPDLTSYRSEITKLLHAHPQVIFTQTDNQTGATYWSEFQQLNNGKMIPAVTGTFEPSWQTTVAKAMGVPRASLGKWFTAMASVPGSKQSFNTFLHWFHTKYPKQQPANIYTSTMYDAVNLMALAMTEAHSTKPSVYRPYVAKLTSDPSADPVYSYAQGVKALKAGKKIFYVGAGGREIFNKYHWVQGDWEAEVPSNASGGWTVTEKLTSAKLASMENGQG